MSGVLFVSNGHGEGAIAARIAMELRTIRPLETDHFALVGEGEAQQCLREVGPRRRMPSGGLIAMGNVRAIAADMAGGLPALTIAQLHYLRRIRGAYRVAVAVGDVWALFMALRARAAATVFVGTAKSVYVAPYGSLEERVLRKARAVFVRDRATAQRLEAHGVPAQPANVIADLADTRVPAPQELPFDPAFALFPGSRAQAYADAVFLCGVVRAVQRTRGGFGALLSIAANLAVDRFTQALAQAGWDVRMLRGELEPFALFDDEREIVRAWRGPIGAALAGARLALGQAGTANEAAAAAGIPVVAFVPARERGGRWYRRRQAALLNGALALVEREPAKAAAYVRALLDDPERLREMGEAGQRRVGPRGARTIASRIAELCARAA